MKLKIARESLLQPLQLVSGVVERRQTLPILSNLLLTVKADQLTMTGTDLEVEMLAHIPLAGADPGEITIPARKFMDICRTLPEDAILEINVDGDRATIRSGKSRFMLSTLPAAEFPKIEANKDLYTFSISQENLKNAIERTHFAMAHQDVRYYLNGMLMEISDVILRLVATDGHRLALCETKIDKKNVENQYVILPRKGVLELIKLLGESGEIIQIQLGNSFMRFSTPDISFTSKLIDGRFPDYQNVVPQGGDKVIICERDLLKQVLNRVSILSNEKYRGVRLQFSSGLLRVLTHNPEQEEAEEEFAIDYNGSGLEIGFNVNYLLDAISACHSEKVQLILSDSNSCCLIQGVGDKNCKYVIMPMRL